MKNAPPMIGRGVSIYQLFAAIHGLIRGTPLSWKSANFSQLGNYMGIQ